MISVKLVLKFLQKDFVLKFLFLVLLCSLVPLTEVFVLLYLGRLIGNYFILAIAASTGLLGLLIIIREFQSNLDVLKRKIREGEYPDNEFMRLAGILAGGVFLLTPGFITDVIGCFLFIPIFRHWVGKLISLQLESNLKEIYEYMSLYDL